MPDPRQPGRDGADGDSPSPDAGSLDAHDETRDGGAESPDAGARSPDAERPDTETSLPGRVVQWFARRGFVTIFGGFAALGFLAERVPPLDGVAWVFFLLAGVLPLVLSTVEPDDEVQGHDYEITTGERVRYVVSLFCWAVSPWGILAQVLQLGGQLAPMVRYRRAYPNRERHVPETELSLPFDGEWTVVNGGVTEATSHSWGAVAQRYAYDFVVAGDGGDSHAGDGTALDDYYAFGEPIRAPAPGTVVAAKDSLRDFPRPGTGWLEWRTWDIRGNHVVIEHADGEYSLLAHLREGSVAVEPGERVERGDVVGECGNSGMSSEPHLHFQLQDHPHFWVAAGLVPWFRDAVVRRDDDRRGAVDEYAALSGDDGPDADGCRASDDVDYLWAGDRVSAGDG